MTGQEWVAEFAHRLGVAPPDDATVEALLALAGAAAHGSERWAAPIACYLVGRAGTDPGRWPDPAGVGGGGTAPTT